MSGAIAIFAKTPGRTPAKTRLAADIGTEAAETFHRLALDAVEASVLRFLRLRPDWSAIWAVAEQSGAQDARWQRLGARHTGPGGLGERMGRVYEELQQTRGRAMLIGADCPQMTMRHLDAATRVLDSMDFVAGPATDGGFWLFGGRRPIPRSLWNRPRYGTSHALDDLVTLLDKAGLDPPHRLDMLSDIDEVTDIAHLVPEMPASRTRAQRRLLDWVARLRQDQR